MKNLTLIYIVLISGTYFGQNSFAESVKIAEYTDTTLSNDCALILFEAKDNGPNEDYNGTLRIWNENISYEVPLDSYEDLEDIIIKSGRYNVEAKLDKAYFSIIEEDFIINNQDMKILKFDFEMKKMPVDFEPQEIPVKEYFDLNPISPDFSPIISEERYSKEVHKDSCLLKLNFIDLADSTEVDAMQIYAAYYQKDGSKKTIDARTKNGNINLTITPTQLFKISFSKSCKVNIKEEIEIDFKNAGAVKEITLDLTPPVILEPDIIIVPIIHEVEKPVIYAYSDKDIDVTFTLKTDAELTFTYPKYDHKWDTKVLASGGFEVNNKQYPYLFWEGEMNLSKHIEQPKVGAIVKKDSVISFLETSLSQMGLNNIEKTDFITFWAPRMMQAKNYYVKFLIDEEYNSSIGSLEYSVKPDSEIRVFMIYSPNPDFTDVQAQTFINSARIGFTVVEWGGSEVLPFIYSID